MVKTPRTAIRADAGDLRPLNLPVPTQVVVKGSRLLAVVVGGKAVGVAELQDTWLSQDEWWRPSPIERHYFVVILDNGQYLVLYRDLVTRNWFVQHHEVP